MLQVPESHPFWASLLANVGWFSLTTPQHTFTHVHHGHLLGGDSHVWLATYRHSIPLSTFENQSPAEGRGCHSRTREERGYTAMNTQLLRYNVLIEHVTFLPIPPADAKISGKRVAHTRCRRCRSAVLYRSTMGVCVKPFQVRRDR